MHLWNHRRQEICASVKWGVSKTDMGFPVWHRADVFYDGLLSVIVRQHYEREAMEESIQQSIWMSV